MNMNIAKLFGVSAIAAALAACNGGDINIEPTSNSVDTGGNNNSGGGPCASYELSGQTFQGAYDGTDCTYGSSFVSDTNPLEVDLTLSSLPNGGIHIFADSLFVGNDVNANDAQAGVPIPQDGEGPTLTIGAGAKIAFSSPSDYVRIARGSRIEATGTASNPIIFSSVTDLRDGLATEGDRGLWGGVQLNGNGITNKCNDEQRQSTANNVHNCHVTAEGRPASYGGNNNAESSGTLRYVVIKHAGFEVVDGNELNALTLNAVGSGTTIEFVETYTSLDDGFEMFGGAVNLKNIVAVNVGDDSIDYSEGYVGNIQFALVVHTSGANRCIEADNTGGGREDNIAPFTKLRISNMTCITSAVKENQGSEPSAKGDSEGPIFREGAFFEMYNSIITANTADMSSQECLELDDTEGPDTIDAVEAGWSVASSNIIACTEPTKLGDVDPSNAGFDINAWFTAENVIVSDPTALPATVIEGLSDLNPRAYITAASFQDANATPIDITPYDVSTLDDDFEPNAEPAIGSSTFFEAVDFIGAVSADDDWVTGWTVGLE